MRLPEPEPQIDETFEKVYIPSDVGLVVGSLAWWVFRTILGMTFVASLTVALDGGLALGLAIGSALAFLAAAANNQGADDDGYDDEDGA